MNYIQLQENQLELLYASLRSIDLTLDRSRWGEWEPACQFILSKVRPLALADEIYKSAELSDPANNATPWFERNSIGTKIVKQYNRIINRKLILSIGEVWFCYKLLLNTVDIINRPVSEFSTEAERHRITVSTFNEEIIAPLLNNSLLTRLSKVEHFDSAPGADTVPLSNFRRT